MKKLLLLTSLLLASGSAFAQHQKGDISVGPNLAFQTSGSSLGVGAKLRYGLTERVRLDAGATYFLPKNSVTSIEASVNAHYLFPLKDSKFTLYPLAGLGYYHNSVKFLGASLSSGKFLFDFGGGASYQLSESLSLGAEAKYLLVSGLNSPQLSINAMFHL